MATIGSKAMPHNRAPSAPDDLTSTLAHHDAAIQSLGGRMHGVESGLRTLQGEVHSGFAGLNNGLTALASKLDAQPRFDFHKMVSTVLSLAVLFSIVVGGIIWVTQSQFSSVIAEQKGVNTAISKALDKHEYRLDRHNERIMKAEESIGRWTTSFASVKGGAR